jgi:hypothetical protein
MVSPATIALRSRRVPPNAADGDLPRIEHIDPQDGACGIFTDAVVMARLSHPADPATLTTGTFRIEDADGPVPARLRLSPDRTVLLWSAERPLRPGVEHVVSAEGIRDQRGQVVASHRSRFVPCEMASGDFPP